MELDIIRGEKAKLLRQFRLYCFLSHILFNKAIKSKQLLNGKHMLSSLVDSVPIINLINKEKLK